MARRDIYSIVLICFVSVILLFYGLGRLDFYDTIESRRLLISMEMVKSGNWLIPEIDGRVLLTKPPFFYWLGALAIKIFRTADEWTIRLPSALSGMGCLIVLYYLAQTLYRGGAGIHPLLLPLIMATTLLFRGCARLGEPDMVMTFFSTASILFFFLFMRTQSLVYGLLFFLGLGLSMFTKGPLGLMIVLLTIFLYLVIYRQVKVFSALPWLSGVLVIIIIFLPWVIFVSLSHSEFFRIVIAETLGRVTGSVSPHSKSIKYYFSKFDSFYFPWSIFLYGVLVYHLIRLVYLKMKKLRVTIQLDEPTGFALLWTGVSLGVLSLISSKRFYYGVIATPPVALLTYCLLCGLGGKKTYWFRGYIRYLVLLLAIGSLLWGILLPAEELVPVLDGEHSPPLRYALIITGIAMIGAIFKPENIIEGAVVGVILGVSALFLYQTHFLARKINEQHSPREAVVLALKLLKENKVNEIVEFGDYNHALHYYLGFTPRYTENVKDVEDEIYKASATNKILFITTRKYWKRLPEALRREVEIIYNSPQTFYSRDKQLYLFLEKNV